MFIMKQFKRILLGIAIILFGATIACSNSSDDILVYIGWGISLVGLVISLTGYFLRNDE